jgi:hypothetical protein
LAPEITQSSPSCVALVRMLPASEPASGSDRANAPDHSPLAHSGRIRSFCSSVPKSLMGSALSSCPQTSRALVAHAFPISSIAIASISMPVPVPPYWLGTQRP